MVGDRVRLMAFDDVDGVALHGQYRYAVEFEKCPVVGGHWSLTLYSVPDGGLVDNPIDRYSIGDRTPGVQYGPDCSLRLVVQDPAPATAERENWLPAPAGPFRLVMRVYRPFDVYGRDDCWPSVHRLDDGTRQSGV